MAYTRVNWQDSPSTATPISASNLNKMDKGIKDLEDSLKPVATSGSYNDLSNTPTIPSALSDLSDDSTHRVVTDTEKSTWSGKQDKVSAKGSTTKPLYTSANGTFSECSTYAGGTAVTLNNSGKGSSTASFYAPTGGGTSGQVLKSNGTSAPTWTNQNTLAIGVQLYNNTSGSNGTITLSETSANYTYIDIFYRPNDGSNYTSFTRVYSPNGKNTCLRYEIKAGGTMYVKISEAQISGNKITLANTSAYYFNIGNNNTINGTNDNQIYITRVVGYK